MNTIGHCPVCAAAHKLTPRGRLPRHGFQARNVRHGGNDGFHVGGHGGQPPIGTEAGNALAIQTAADHEAIAARLESLPPPGRDDAIQSALTEAHAGEMKRWGRAPTKAAPAWPTVQDIETDTRWLRVRGWFSDDALSLRAMRLRDARRQKIWAHREHAANLRRLVSETPQAEGA